MAYTTIDKPEDHFNTILYSGNSGTSRALTGVGFKPGFLWIKRRNASERNLLTNPQYPVDDGAYKWDDSGDAAAAFGGGAGVASFDSDGFTFKASDATWNASNNTYVAWSWKDSGSSPASNTEGGTRYVTVSANTDAGFSHVRLLGGLNDTSTGHGLGVTPDVVLLKRENASVGFRVFHKDVGEDKYLALDTPTAVVSEADSFSTLPTSTVFTGGVNLINATDWFNCYCFASKQGYSKFGKYLANANVDGPMVYTGFKPAWLLRKATTRAEPWMLIDNRRNPSNPVGTYLDPSIPAGDAAGVADVGVDFLANGFKVRTGSTSYGNHTSGNVYLYMAFAEEPLVTSTGVPATAR